MAAGRQAKDRVDIVEHQYVSFAGIERIKKAVDVRTFCGYLDPVAVVKIQKAQTWIQQEIEKVNRQVGF